MKKFSRILACLLSLSILLSLNAFAADHVDFVLNEEKSTSLSPVYDVTVHSGAVIAEREYAEKKEYEDDYYEIYSVTFDASGTEPIIVNKQGFSGYWGHICSLSFNGNGDIYLGESAFSGLSVQKLILPANIKFLENAKGVFDPCLNLKSVDIYCELVPWMFDDCNYLEEVNLKGNITEIPDNAFSACALRNIDIPDMVKRIGKNAFSGNLTLVNRFNLPEGLETIGAYAFYGTDISSPIIIPASVTNIGEKAFGYSGYIGNPVKDEDFTIYGYSGTAAETYAEENGFTFIPLDNSGELINVVLNSGDVVEENQYNTGHDEENGLIEYDPNYKYVDTVTFNATGTDPIVVKTGAFCASISGTYAVNNIVFNGTGAIFLGSWAFSGLAMSSLKIPSNVFFEENVSCVFSESKLSEVEIDSFLCPAMFSECYILKKVIFSDNSCITEIPEQAFSSCFALKTFTVPSTVKEIGDYAFFSNWSLETIDLNTGLESIGDYSFAQCENLKSITIPDSMISIGKKSFIFTQIKSVRIPRSVTYIGEKAFGYNGETSKIDGFTIYGYSGTAAETYAEENGFTFIPLEDNVTDVTYTPSWSSVNDYGFTVSGRADKLQVIEANGGTRTVTRNSPNVVIKSYDINGNEVSSLSRELDYEVWTVNTRLTPDTELQVHAKYNNEWVDATYRFSVSTLYSDKTLKKAELSSTSGGQGMVDCNIVTGSGVSKVRVEYEDGMTSTYNSSYATLDVENMTYTYDISVKAYRTGEIPYKIYIKTPSGWQYATTLTYTAE